MQLTRIAVFSLLLVTTTIAAQSENIFKNVTVGFEVEKPAQWQFVSADQHFENVKKTHANDEQYKEMIAKYATAPLVAMMKFPEPFDDLNPTFKVNVKPYGNSKGVDPKQILSIILSQVSQQKITQKDFRIVQEPIDVEISGIKSGYARINYSLQIPDGRLFPTASELWIVPKSNYFFMIGAATRQDEKTGTRQEIQKILKSIKVDIEQSAPPDARNDRARR